MEALHQWRRALGPDIQQKTKTVASDRVPRATVTLVKDGPYAKKQKVHSLTGRSPKS